ncbi:MAG TPA: serine hydrolase domain-containing protein [Capsulimonadaceae bacterium]|jgi:CubicO group peptidase (beta-lactamase class C family)
MNTIALNSATRLQGDLERILGQLVDDGYELGVQAAVYLRGELVADVCVGTVSSHSSLSVQPDTVFPVCSTGKGILATLAHILAERGVIDYIAPVADYWPEFGVNGKAAITVAQAMSHQAGIPTPPVFVSLDEACDFDAACARVAQLTPEWTPGSTMQYHSRSWGWIVGGLIRHATGTPIGQLLRDEITGPLGTAGEMFFGITEEADKRYSAFEPQPTQRAQITTAPSSHEPPPPTAIDALKLPLNDFVNLPQVRRCCMPAVNGIMSARAIAKHYAALIGEVDGVRLVSSERLALATTRVTREGTTPECFGHGFGLGYCLKGPAGDMGAFFGHGGAGGSEGMANRRLGMALGMVKNRMDTHSNAPDHTNLLMIRAIYDVLGHEGDGGFYGVKG